MIVLLLLACQADLSGDIATAQKRAAAENRRVLVVWGATDALSTTLKKDREVSRKILYEYDLVHADAKHEELAKKLGADLSKLPWLTILAADGKTLANAESPAEAKALVELLAKHQAEPWKAKEVLEAGMKRAKEEKKRVLLTFGAPW